jgi:hypothetical protein
MIIQVLGCLPVYLIAVYFISLKTNEKAYAIKWVRNLFSTLSIIKIRDVFNNK